MTKRKGSTSTFPYIYLVLLLVIVLMVQLQLSQYNATKLFVEDALAMSNLASAVIDIETYGISHDIIIKNPDAAYLIYQEALRNNLNLEDDWTSNKQYSISGKVDILEYIIFNVVQTDVEIYTYSPQGSSHTTVSNGVGSVTAPDGTTIESTSIYSRIGFPVDGMLGIHVDAKKEKTVDIVENL
jgi:hypothetical protein